MAFMSASLGGVSIDRLNTLCAVVEAGTIAAAAGPDLNRQSQFSRQIKELEKALGANLFERSGKTLKANETGRPAGQSQGHGGGDAIYLSPAEIGLGQREQPRLLQRARRRHGRRPGQG